MSNLSLQAWAMGARRWANIVDARLDASACTVQRRRVVSQVGRTDSARSTRAPDRTTWTCCRWAPLARRSQSAGRSRAPSGVQARPTPEPRRRSATNCRLPSWHLCRSDADLPDSSQPTRCSADDDALRPLPRSGSPLLSGCLRVYILLGMLRPARQLFRPYRREKSRASTRCPRRAPRRFSLLSHPRGHRLEAVLLAALDYTAQ